MSGLHARATENARAGFRVFPLRPRDKQPLLRGWQRSASTDPAVVESAWLRTPNANIGIACGDGLVVVDADSDRAEDALGELGLPATTSVKTARGSHRYFQGEAGNRTGVLDGVDVRGGGGYVVGAGSLHPNGAGYEWLVPPWELPPVPLPDTLASLLDDSKQTANRRSLRADLASEILPGARNRTLFRLACHLRGLTGTSADELAEILAGINRARCRPPLDADEVAWVARSAAKYDAAPLWITNPMAFACDPQLGAYPRLVLVALCRYANCAGKCHPGVRRLHADTGMATDTIRAATATLEAAHRVRVQRGKQGKSSRYELLDRFVLLRPEGERFLTGSSVLPLRTPKAGT